MRARAPWVVALLLAVIAQAHAQTSAPTLDFLQGDDIKITLTNLGLIQRPDLTDAHTIHWHGFDMPSPLNDGVPEVSAGGHGSGTTGLTTKVAPSSTRASPFVTERAPSPSPTETVHW